MNKIVSDFTLFEEALVEAADLVASTIGPFGGNVSIAGDRERKTFDDGFKAIQAYQPSDRFKNEAVRRIQDALHSQLAACGDGTSTTTLLLTSLYFEARKLVADGHKERDVIRAFEVLTDMVCDELDNMAIKATVGNDGMEKGNPDILTKVATVAMHGDKKLGKLIGELVADIGKYGMIGAEPGTGRDIEVVRATGYSWKGGVPDASLFNTHGSARYGESLVLIVNEVCSDSQTPGWKAVLDTWQRMRQEEQKDLGLILISRGATGSVMSLFAKRTHAQTGQRFPMCILRPPGESDAEVVPMLNDIANITGATVFDQARGVMLKGDFKASDFGRVAGVHGTLTHCSLKLASEIDLSGTFGPVNAEDSRRAAVAAIEAAMKEQSGNADFLALAKKRIANLEGAVATLRIPAMSDTAFSEMSEQLEDGYRSAMSALDGVVPGGGKALFSAAEMILESGDVVSEIEGFFTNAIKEPISTLYGKTPYPVIFDGSEDTWTVVDIATGVIGNAVDLGILDSLNVVKSALRSAMSVAMPLVNTKRWLVSE